MNWLPRLHRVQGGLVDEVGQVGARHPGRPAGDDRQVQVRAHPLVLAVHLQDGEALVEVGERHDDLAVETARTEQRGVKDVGSVGRGHDDDALGDVETVHFVQHLVQGLLALVVAAAETGAALASYRVDLVDEDDRRCLLARRLEEITHPARADADEHLHEVRPAHRKEGDAGLAGNGSREQRLSCAGRADQQDAFRHTSADLLEATGRLEEVDDFADLLFDALIAGHVVEGRTWAFGRVDLGLGAPDRHDAGHLPLGPAAHPDEEADDQGDRKQVEEDLAEAVRARGREGVLDPGCFQRGVERVRELDRACRRIARAVGERARNGTGGIVEAGSGDLVGREVMLEHRENDGLGAAAIEHARADEKHDQDDDDDDKRPAPGLVRGRRAAGAGPSRPVVLRLTTHANHRRRHRHKVGPRGLLGRLYQAPTFG